MENAPTFEQQLKKLFPKGSTAFTSVTKVAPSGMSRHIQVFKAHGVDEMRFPTYMIAEYLDMRYKDETQSIFVGGCGMDMGFHLIYRLSSKLYDDGYAIKQRWLN